MNTRWWYSKAKCRELPDTDIERMFFPTTGSRSTEGKKFCHDCPVKQQCLNFAILYHEQGVWGGTNDQDRKYLSSILYLQIRVETIEVFGILETRDTSDWLPKQRLTESFIDDSSDLIRDNIIIDDCSGF